MLRLTRMGDRPCVYRGTRVIGDYQLVIPWGKVASSGLDAQSDIAGTDIEGIGSTGGYATRR